MYAWIVYLILNVISLFVKRKSILKIISLYNLSKREYLKVIFLLLLLFNIGSNTFFYSLLH